MLEREASLLRLYFTMLEELRQQIREILEQATSPVVLWSAGKDSTLLLALAREVVPDISILYFRDRVSLLAKQIILDWDLTVLGYAPAARYLIPWADGIALVDEISLGGTFVPLLRDVVLGDDPCDLERLPHLRTLTFDYQWPTTLYGYRHTDPLHPCMPQPFAKVTQLPSTALIAPLFDLQDKEIDSLLSQLGLEYPFATDTVSTCADCLKALGNWNREQSLAYFSKRFGYAQAA